MSKTAVSHTIKAPRLGKQGQTDNYYSNRNYLYYFYHAGECHFSSINFFIYLSTFVFIAYATHSNVINFKVRLKSQIVTKKVCIRCPDFNLLKQYVNPLS